MNCAKKYCKLQYFIQIIRPNPKINNFDAQLKLALKTSQAQKHVGSPPQHYKPPKRKLSCKQF